MVVGVCVWGGDGVGGKRSGGGAGGEGKVRLCAREIRHASVCTCGVV